MGMEDREYYWEDRKRRENKFDKKDTYYRPNEFRQTDSQKRGKPSKVLSSHRHVVRKQWKILFAFLAGSFITFWALMVVLNLKPDLLLLPFDITRQLIGYFDG